MRQAEPASCVGGKRSPPLVDATADYSRTVGRLSLCRVFLTTALDLLPSTAYLNDGAGQLIQTLSPCQATAIEIPPPTFRLAARAACSVPLSRCCRVLTGLFGPAAVTRRHYAPDLAFRELVGAVAQPLLGVGDLQESQRLGRRFQRRLARQFLVVRSDLPALRAPSHDQCSRCPRRAIVHDLFSLVELAIAPAHDARERHPRSGR